MMQTKLTVLMPLILCGILFNGCANKTVYLPCKAEKPIRTARVVCGLIKDDKLFGECAQIKYLNLEKDYDILSTRFDSCK